MRGSDIDHNPVFESFAVIFNDRAICFCHKSEEKLGNFCPGWEFRPYEEYKLFLNEISKNLNLRVWLDPTSITMGIRLIFSEDQIIEKVVQLFLLRQ